MKLNKNIIIKWLRLLHRDLGYFLVGVTLVYAISGVLLNHKGEKDPAFKTIIIQQQFPKALTSNGVSAHWNDLLGEHQLNRVIPANNGLDLFLKGGLGHYDPISGMANIEVYKKRPIVAFLIQLHFNQKTGWKWIADFYAISLLFLAISGIFLVQGKNGLLRRGIWLIIAGVALVVLFSFIP